MKKHLCALFFLLIFLFQKAEAQSVIIDNESDNVTIPVQALQVLKDSTGVLQFGEIIENGIFFPATAPLNLNKNAYYWIKITLYGNPYSTVKHVLEVENKDVELIELYQPINESDYTLSSTGTLLPFSSRDYQHIHFVFDVDVNYEGSRDFFLRIKSKHPIYFKGSIKTQSLFSKHLILKYLTLGVFYGTLCLLFFFGLLLFITRKELVYLFLSLVIVGGGFISLVMDGSGFIFLWNSRPTLSEFAIYATPILLLTTFALLSRAYLNLQTHLPKLDQFLIGTVILYLLLSTVVFSAAHPFLTTEKFEYIQNTIYALPYLGILIGSILSWERKVAKSNYFTIGFGVLLLSFGIKSLVLQGLYAHTFLGDLLLENSLKIGFVFFLTFLIKGLSDTPALKTNKNIEDKTPINSDSFKALQTTFLPSKETLIETLNEYFVFYKPKTSVSSNYYFVHTKKDVLQIAVMEIKANDWLKSLIITIAHGLLHELSKESGTFGPKTIAQMVEDRVVKNPILKEVEFSIGIYELNKQTLSLSYYSTGVRGLLVGNEETHSELSNDDNDSTDEHQIVIEKGQKLYLYTSGIEEQINKETSLQFSAKRTSDLLSNSSRQSFGKQYKEIKSTLEKWQGSEPQTSDIFILGLKI